MKTWISLLALFIVTGCVGQPSPVEGGVEKTHESGDLAFIELKIQGMTCPSCATGIEFALKQINGVVDSEVTYEEGRGKVIYDPSAVGEEEIIEGVKPFKAEVVARGKT